MKYADFRPGMVFERGPRLVTEDEIIEFATKYDPQWFHVNRELSSQGPWKRVIASGWMTCGIAMEMAVDAVLGESEAFASPGVESVRWRKPVFPNDQLTWRGTIKHMRLSNSRPGIGIMLWSWEMTNQDNEIVLELDATSLFKLSEPS